MVVVHEVVVVQVVVVVEVVVGRRGGWLSWWLAAVVVGCHGGLLSWWLVIAVLVFVMIGCDDGCSPRSGGCSW